MQFIAFFRVIVVYSFKIVLNSLALVFVGLGWAVGCWSLGRFDVFAGEGLDLSDVGLYVMIVYCLLLWCSGRVCCASMQGKSNVRQRNTNTVTPILHQSNSWEASHKRCIDSSACRLWIDWCVFAMRCSAIHAGDCCFDVAVLILYELVASGLWSPSFHFDHKQSSICQTTEVSRD
jgi:hypothetical protein